MSDTLMDPLNCLIYGVAGRLVARSGARTVSPLDNLYGRPRLRLRFFLSVLMSTSAGSVLRCARANTLGVESLQYDGKHSAAIKANTATIATSTVTGSAKSPLSVGCVAGGAGDDGTRRAAMQRNIAHPREAANRVVGRWLARRAVTASTVATTSAAAAAAATAVTAAAGGDGGDSIGGVDCSSEPSPGSALSGGLPEPTPEPLSSVSHRPDTTSSSPPPPFSVPSRRTCLRTCLR